jgi:hypothetical protein
MDEVQPRAKDVVTVKAWAMVGTPTRLVPSARTLDYLIISIFDFFQLYPQYVKMPTHALMLP